MITGKDGDGIAGLGAAVDDLQAPSELGVHEGDLAVIFCKGADESGKSDDVDPPERFAPTRVEDSPRLGLDLESGQVRSIVWATGFRPDYSWLHVPVLDHKGQIRHSGGVADAPGMYVLGLTFLRRRKSSFIHGAEDDARDLTDHLAGYLIVVLAEAQYPLARNRPRD